MGMCLKYSWINVLERSHAEPSGHRTPRGSLRMASPLSRKRRAQFGVADHGR